MKTRQKSLPAPVSGDPELPSKLAKSKNTRSKTIKPRIEELVPLILDRLGDNTLAAIYRDRIRTERTRRYELPARPLTGPPVRIEIMHTLLGIELKIGRRRLVCPDLSTARYLSVFARMGVGAIAVPYDITRIARLADDLESAWFRMHMIAEDLLGAEGERALGRLMKLLVRQQREVVEALGPGPVAPRFNR